MSQLSAVLLKTRDSCSFIKIPLALTCPDQTKADLNKCLYVQEDEWYEIELQLELQQIQLPARKSDQTSHEYALFPDFLSPHQASFHPFIPQDKYNPTDAFSTTAPTRLISPAEERQINNISCYVNDRKLNSLTFERTDNNNFGTKVIYQGRPVDNKEYLAGYPFLLQWDLVLLQFRVEFTDDTALKLYSDYLICTTKNPDEIRNINQILNELTNLHDNAVLDLMFRQDTPASSLTSDKPPKEQLQETPPIYTNNSIKAYLALLEQIIHSYTVNLQAFTLLTQHKIVKTHALKSFYQIRSISSQSHSWLAHNLQVLKEVPATQEGIVCQGKHYLPQQLLGEINCKSYDTYENQVILSFLQMVIHYSLKVRQEHQELLQTREAQLPRPQQEHHQLPPQQEPQWQQEQSWLYQQPQLQLKPAYSNVTGSTTSTSCQAPILTFNRILLEQSRQDLTRLQEQITRLNRLLLKYQELFQLKTSITKHTPLIRAPRQTRIFHEIRPYAQIFKMITHWFRCGVPSLQKERLMLQVNTLDKLFEYYCLYKLLDMLLHQGFKPVSGPDAATTFHYPEIPYHDIVANTFRLERGAQQITVYYQPVISDSEFHNNLYMFKTYNKYQSNTGYRYYHPDFILKFTPTPDEINADYVVLDAKFSRERTIINYYLDTIVTKYGINTTVLRLQPKTSSPRNLPDINDRADGIPGLMHYDIMGTCSPRMIMALQGRIPGSRQSMFHYHNTPLAWRFRPTPDIGICCVNARQDALNELWEEITLCLPYLKN